MKHEARVAVMCFKIPGACLMLDLLLLVSVLRLVLCWFMFPVGACDGCWGFEKRVALFESLQIRSCVRI